MWYCNRNTNRSTTVFLFKESHFSFVRILLFSTPMKWLFINFTLIISSVLSWYRYQCCLISSFKCRFFIWKAYVRRFVRCNEFLFWLRYPSSFDRFHRSNDIIEILAWSDNNVDYWISIRCLCWHWIIIILLLSI